MNTSKLFKSILLFLVCSFWRNICLFIILGLVFTSSTQPELKPLLGDYGKQSHLEHDEDLDPLVIKLNDLRLNSRMWHICGSNSWEDLKHFLPEAKMASLSVWAILIPPYQSSPINPDCTYSEPFAEDYILWAKEIAKLSLRYSNLVGYGIDNFQENTDLGYFTQTYIDSMIAAGKSINPLLQFINTNASANIYYVDKGATGNGSGSDWTNAATSVSALDWSILQAGDTVYISGGEVSKIYPKDKIEYKAVNGRPIVVTKGWENGHNGKVVFQQTEPVAINDWERYSFYVRTCKNIKITGLTFNSTVPDSSENYAASIIKVKECENIIIDKCHIVSPANGYGININGIGGKQSKFISITNNLIETLETDSSPYGQDPIWIGNNFGGHIITGNILIHRGESDNVSLDIIQMHREGSPENYEMIIANNFMYAPRKDTKRNRAVYMDQMKSHRLLFCNNLMVLNTQQNSGFLKIRTDDTCRASARVFNNTGIGGSDGDHAWWYESIDTVIMKNNISIFDSVGFTHVMFGGDGIYNVSYINWTQWQNKWGFDANSDTGYINFTNLWGTDILDYLTSTGRDAGVDLSAYFTTDLRKVKRPKGAGWDKGALESSAD
jgi:hypothetical protein